jgi:hypothetical protein
MVRTYRVFGISCDHCKQTIESQVATVDGVRLVEVDVEHKTVRVGGDASQEAIRAAIAEAGYEVAQSISS